MKVKYLLYTLLLTGLVSSCADDKNSLLGEGQVMMRPTISAELKQSRTAKEDLPDKLVLWIGRADGSALLHEYIGMENVPSSLTMYSGDYTVMAWAGDSVSASWDKQWYKAVVPFTVTTGQTTTVDIPCKIANVVVSVEYDSSVDEVLQDCELTVQHARGSLTFDDEHINDMGYFMMPSSDKNLSWTLTGIKKEDGATTYTVTNVIENAKPGYHYTFKVKCEKGSDDPMGGAFLNIVIDESEVEVINEEIKLAVAPVIQGRGFDIDEVQYAAPNELPYCSVYITAAGTMTSVIVDCQQFDQIFGTNSFDFDVRTMWDTIKTQLNDLGAEFQYEENPTEGTSTMIATFSAEFMNKFYGTEGDYQIKFTVTDSNDRTSTKTVKYHVSADPISVLDVDTSDVAFSHKQAPLVGDILMADDIDSSSLNFLYRQNGDTEWKSTDATVSGSQFLATITELSAGTVYQFKASVTRNDGSGFETSIKTFTTEPATQLPNSSFEDWQTSSSPYLLYASGGEMFWDSGNHGSSTMNKNVTVPGTDYVHSGVYSVKLASQFVGIGIIGKFAAGNVFIGKYLDTDGTDGVLGWGRAFTGRPSKLKGYMRYEPATVDYTNSGASDIVEGQPDKGIIYIALLDDNTETYNGEAWPVVIKTKSSERQLFDSSTANSHIIAYGEMVLNETYGGSGMAEFEIPLDYRRTDIRPTYILCTASASKGGDYFAGGSGSTMWLDDLELIYE